MISFSSSIYPTSSLINCVNDGLFIENQNSKKNQREKSKSKKNPKNVVKRANFLSKNEIRISERIMEIPCFFVNFGPILKYRDFKLAEIDDERFEKCKILKDSVSSYFLFQYENREKMCDFLSFFEKAATKREKTMKIIQSFKNLLQAIKKLDERNLVNMNLVPSSILFKEDETPYLVNFDHCLVYPKEEDERKSNQENQELENLLFSDYNPRKIHLPIEVHLLCYMNHKNLVSLSAANIETVINEWFCGVSLSPFGKYISEEFKGATTALFSQRGLINKPKYWIKEELLSFAETWNNYSLSIIFLYLLSSSLGYESENHNFVKGFIQLLLQNISGIGSKRESVKKTLEVFDELIYSITQEEWRQL